MQINEKMLQGAFGMLQKAKPQYQNLMNAGLSKAMEVAQKNGNPAAVIGVLKNMVSNTEHAGKLNDPELNRILSSFENQDTENIVPHAKKVATNMGVWQSILGFFGGALFGKKQG